MGHGNCCLSFSNRWRCGLLVGVRKERELPKILSDQLVVKASDVVLKTLKKQSEATKKDLAGLLDGLVVGPFWSSRKLKITDPEKFGYCATSIGGGGQNRRNKA